MAEAAPHPDGIPGSRLSGPWPVGDYAAALRDRLRGFKRVQVFGEVFGLKVGRAKVWFELRDSTGALPCSMWRKDWDALRLDTLGDGAVVVAAGGCDFYPGSRASSPSFSFAVTKLRVAGEGDLLAQVERLRRAARRGGAVRAAEAPAPAVAAAHDRRRLRRGRQGARRRAGRPAPPRLGGHAGVGVRARAGPPRRARDHARAAGPRRLRGGRGDRRRARRRLARRPVRVLRRDAVPHGRAAARAGHLLRRPPHRPHADRRRRRGRVLDARRTPPRPPCPSTAPPPAPSCAASPRGWRSARGWRSSSAPACSRGSRARPPTTSTATAPACASTPASCARPPAAGSRPPGATRRPPRSCSSARRAPRRAPSRPSTRATSSGSRSALAAHEPQRALERGYALVEDAAGEPVTSAAAVREHAELTLRLHDGTRVRPPPAVR